MKGGSEGEAEGKDFSQEIKNQTPIRVLVVDHTQGIRNILKTSLKHNGNFIPVLSRDFNEAKASIEQGKNEGPIQIIFAECSFLAQLSSLEELRDVPVITYDEREDVTTEEAKSSGATMLLLGGFKVDEAMKALDMIAKTLPTAKIIR